MKLVLVAVAAAILTLQAAAAAPTAAPSVYPPWQHGRNNPATQRGLEFTVPPVDDLADFHGNPFTAQLVIFLGGNYYFAMAPLAHAFVAEHPEFKGRLYYETIPPGLLERQMRAGGTITVGNMTWTAKPDVFTGGRSRVLQMQRAGLLTKPAVNFASNRLTLMVHKGNPAHITSLADLARPGLRLAMPNPAFEGVARQIQASLKKAGGVDLLQTVYGRKVANGQTILTHIHHRQTPLWLMQKRVDAGVTWLSEARFMEQSGHPIGNVRIPPADNTTATYSGAVVKHAAHPRAARLWLHFLASPRALKILEGYGFTPPPHTN